MEQKRFLLSKLYSKTFTRQNKFRLYIFSPILPIHFVCIVTESQQMEKKSPIWREIKLHDYGEKLIKIKK